jgi:hypothetical protein
MRQYAPQKKRGDRSLLVVFLLEDYIAEAALSLANRKQAAGVTQE